MTGLADPMCGGGGQGLPSSHAHSGDTVRDGGQGGDGHLVVRPRSIDAEQVRRNRTLLYQVRKGEDETGGKAKRRSERFSTKKVGRAWPWNTQRATRVGNTYVQVVLWGSQELCSFGVLGLLTPELWNPASDVPVEETREQEGRRRRVKKNEGHQQLESIR